MPFIDEKTGNITNNDFKIENFATAVFGELQQMNSQETGFIDTLRTIKNSNSPGHAHEGYAKNSIITDGYTDKGLTLTMNSL